MKTNLSKRAQAASAKQAGALSLFHRAADELDAAAEAHRKVQSEADAIAAHYDSLAGTAHIAAQESANAASKIRDLIGA